METVGSAAISETSAGSESAAMVMACSICDVMWRGRLGDSCWACGHSVHTVKAPPMQVKIPAPA